MFDWMLYKAVFLGLGMHLLPLVVLGWVICALYHWYNRLDSAKQCGTEGTVLTIITAALVPLWVAGLGLDLLLMYVFTAFGYSHFVTNFSMYLPLIVMLIVWFIAWRAIKPSVQYSPVLTVLARIVYCVLLTLTILAVYLAIGGVVAIFYPPHAW